MPNGAVTYLEARLLTELVNSAIHPIRCASTCGRKAQKGLLLGDLCAEAHHPMWALKIWKFTLAQIHSKDYDDWIDVRFNTERIRLKGKNLVLLIEGRQLNIEAIDAEQIALVGRIDAVSFSVL